MNLLLKRAGLLWAGCLFLVLLASLLGRPAVLAGEDRTLAAAWEMWSGGDWLVMHANGKPWHQAPLQFWLIGLGWGIFGVNDWWPRALSALLALACVALAAALVRRLWPREEGVGERAGWLLLGFAPWLFSGTAAAGGTLLVACILLALLAGEGKGGWMGMGAGLGLGFLAAGPVVLVLALPPLLLSSGRRGLGLGLLTAAAIALAWAIPAALAGEGPFLPRLLATLAAGSGLRFTSAFNPLLLPLLLFPWLFWGGAWKAAIAAARSGGERGVRYGLAGLLAACAALVLLDGPGVVVLPPLALILAFGLGRTRWIGRHSLLPLALVLAAAAGLLILSPLWTGPSWVAPYAGLSWQIGGSFLLALAVLVLFCGPGPDAMPRLALVSATLAAVVLVALVKPLGPALDPAPLAARLKGLESQGVPLAHAGQYRGQYHFPGRLDHPLEEIGREGIAGWLEAHPQGRVVVRLPAAAPWAEFSQPWLDGSLALVDARSAGRLK